MPPKQKPIAATRARIGRRAQPARRVERGAQPAAQQRAIGVEHVHRRARLPEIGRAGRDPVQVDRDADMAERGEAAGFLLLEPGAPHEGARHQHDRPGAGVAIVPRGIGLARDAVMVVAQRPGRDGHRASPSILALRPRPVPSRGAAANPPSRRPVPAPGAIRRTGWPSAAERVSSLDSGGDFFAPMTSRLLSLIGILIILAIAMALSSNRRWIRLRVVGAGVRAAGRGSRCWCCTCPQAATRSSGWRAGSPACSAMRARGRAFLFGPFAASPLGQNFALQALPVIIFFASLVSILYHLGIMQRIVRWVGGAIEYVIGVSKVEALCAAANIFVGQSESPLVIRPYLAALTPAQR